VYGVLIERYEIPVVIVYGREGGCDEMFPKSKVVYVKMYLTNEATNDMNIVRTIGDIVMVKPTHRYEKAHGINRWFNFWVADFQYRTKQVQIASQFSVNDPKMDLVTCTTKILSNMVPVSIHLPSKHTPHTIPPLIDLKSIDRSEVDDTLVLCYSVSGQDFPTRLAVIARAHPDHRFKYFTRTSIITPLPENVVLYKPDKVNFQKFIRTCGTVLCTAGNQLILECVHNKIPHAIMPCSDTQFEQVQNIDKYVRRLRYSEPMTNGIDLDVLIRRDMTASHQDLATTCENRDEKIVRLVDL
jgi:hypothetical protein